jgi:hypothetical protein
MLGLRVGWPLPDDGTYAWRKLRSNLLRRDQEANERGAVTYYHNPGCP